MIARCYVRASSRKQQDSPIVQRGILEKKCREMGYTEIEWYEEDLGTSARALKFRDRKEGKRLMLEVQKGDTVLFSCLSRMGRTMTDIIRTAEWLAKRGVAVIALDFLGCAPIDNGSSMGRVFLAIFAAFQEADSNLRIERTLESIASRKERGIWCAGYPCRGKKKVRNEDGKGYHSEWDFEQLEIIAELAKRLGQGENIKSIHDDFRRRELRDWNGRPWGLYVSKKSKTVQSPYLHFFTRVRWFHRAGRRGELPPPYGEVAAMTPTKEGFTMELRPKRKCAKPKLNGREEWTQEQYEEHLLNID
jgi:DNA invertase Pin-like site-specific DNA recombinase